MNVFTLRLLRPRYLAFCHELAKHRTSLSLLFRDAIILALFLSFSWGIYFGTHKGLEQLQEYSELSYLNPFVPLAILFFLLMGMMFFSALAAGYSALYSGLDEELLRSSPLSEGEILRAKLARVFLSTVWMPCVLLIPFLSAYGAVYEAGVAFWLIALALLPFYVSISVFLGTLLASFAPLVLSPSVRKVFFSILAVIVLSVLLFIGQSLWLVLSQEELSFDVSGVLHKLSLSQYTWIPSHWIAYALREQILGSQGRTLYLVTALCACSVTLFALLHLTQLLFGNMLRLRVEGEKKNERKRVSPRTHHSFFPLSIAATLRKDWICFRREPSQFLQVFFLFLLVGGFLLQARFVKFLRGDEVYTSTNIQHVLLILHLGIGAFVSTALCTRLVFPSMSLEGKTWWFLRSSPVALRDIVYRKFFFWLFPVLTPTVLVFILIALMGDVNMFNTLLLIMNATGLSIALVGLAMGLGCVYVDFRWEHPSELIASFGSIVFMLSASGVILLSMLAVSVCFRLPASSLDWWLWAVSTFCLQVLLAKLSVRWGSIALARVDHQ